MKQENTLYLECRSGISGDMTVAALLDLGASEENLRGTLKKLPLDGYEIKVEKVKKNGLEVCDFDVILTEEPDHQSHRTWRDIREMLEQAELKPRVRELSLQIFEAVAEAEAKVHGCEPEKVHFHETGAVDSIVDIVSAAACMEDLQVERVVASELWDGSGYIRCRHGVLPVPVPAVLEIAAGHGLTLRQTERDGEMVTPTGAAIASLSEGDRPGSFTVKRVGMGAGKREYPQVNILRAMLIEEH